MNHSRAADIDVELAFFYKTSESSSGTTSSETSTTIMDARIGYLPKGDYLIGVQYAKETITTTSTASSENARTSIGPSLGWVFNNGIRLMGTYFIMAELSLGGTTVLTGSGMQGDVSYLFKLWKDLQIGPRLSYKKFSYDEDEASGALTAEREDTIMEPSILFMYQF